MSPSFASYSCVLYVSRPGTLLTVQALSEDDYRFWLQAMGGKEPVSYTSAQIHLLAILSHKNANWYIFKTWKRHRNVFFSNRLATPSRGPTLKREEVCNLAALNNWIRENSNISSFGWFSIFFFLTTAVDAQLDDVGLSFLKNSINAIETRGELRVNDFIGPGFRLHFLFFWWEIVFFNILVYTQPYKESKTIYLRTKSKSS